MGVACPRRRFFLLFFFSKVLLHRLFSVQKMPYCVILFSTGVSVNKGENPYDGEDNCIGIRFAAPG